MLPAPDSLSSARERRARKRTVCSAIPCLVNSVLGIDVSKATLACTLVDPTSHQVLWQVLWQATYPRQATYPNSPQGVQSLIERTPHQAAWVMEPTGRYSLLVASLSPPCRLLVAKPAKAAGRQVLFKCCSSAVQVLLAPSRQARLYLQSRQSRAKTRPRPGQDRSLGQQGAGLFRPGSALAQPWLSRILNHCLPTRSKARRWKSSLNGCRLVKASRSASVA